MWMKWRHKFAWGTNEWHWKDLGEVVGDGKAEALIVADILTSECESSDMYRGLDYELLQGPPVHVLREQLEAARDQEGVWRAAAERLEALIAKAEG